MAQYVYGLLHGVDEKKRVIAIKDKFRVIYYYMAKGIFQSFMQYFNQGIFVFMFVEEDSRRYRGLTVQNVVNVEKVLSPNKQNPTIFYDISIIKSGIESIMNTKKPKLFLDFEMSMPPYRNYNTFISEIIQVGYILTNDEGKIIEKRTTFILPTFFREISERTKRFLHIDQSDIETGISYLDFYHTFSQMLSTYKPMVIVWGQNDHLELKKMNKLHNLLDFTPRTQFIDLLKLHKLYFSLKNDLGLFNAYNLYQEVDLNTQMHDAYEDAYITKIVFDSFLKVCNGEITVSIEKHSEQRTNEDLSE
ncbi:MAG: exonuclease domain-containing protein [Candidatus Izemoplasmatales bacterium]|jgi:sporulation inhibitor KapD|nr:exonuclease domain-containing protein [Candidatus Izemoplasmatales bacterium]